MKKFKKLKKNLIFCNLFYSLFTENGEKTFYEEQYESIYEVIRPPESESDFEEIPEEEVFLLQPKCFQDILFSLL